MAISTDKLEAVAEIGSLACEAAWDDGLVPVILSRLEALLDADGAVFYDMAGPFARPVFRGSHYRGINPDYGKLYSDYYNRLDPCFDTLAADTKTPFLLTASTARAVDDRSGYVRSEYYQDFLRPQEIHSSIIFSLRNERELLGLFGFQRPVSRPEFDDDSHLLVRLVGPAIAQALNSKRQSGPDRMPTRVSVGNVALTPRQVEIAELVTRGLTNAEIASQLRISAKTVENQLTRIYAIIGASNRVTLAQSLSFILHQDG